MTQPGGGLRPGCSACWPETATAAWEARKALVPGVELVDDSHFGIRLLGCPACRQLFASVFVEDVDWVDGEDSQFWTMVPLAAEEAESLRRLEGAALVDRLGALGAARACLHRDYPKGSLPSVTWRPGVTRA